MALKKYWQSKGTFNIRRFVRKNVNAQQKNDLQICEKSAITWFGKKEKGKQSEVNIHLCWSCSVLSPRRARIHSQVRLLECAALTSSACAGTAERSKSQQRGFSSCHNLTVFCYLSASGQSRFGISSELPMCLSQICF